MATNSNEKLVQIFDFSGAVQRKSTDFMTVKNQVELSINAKYDRTGGVEKIYGHDRVGNTITTVTTSSSTSTTTSSTSTSTSTSSSTSTSTSTSSTTTG